MLSGLLEVAGLAGLTVAAFLAFGVPPGIAAGSVGLLILGQAADGVSIKALVVAWLKRSP